MAETKAITLLEIPDTEMHLEAIKLFAAIAESNERPTDEQLDRAAKLFDQAEAWQDSFAKITSFIEAQSVPLVEKYGVVVANAEKSRQLRGTLSTFKVTKSDTLTIDDERVVELKNALEANEFGQYFSKLFVPRTKWEVVKGAETALKAESLPKRLAEKVIRMWGRCIDVKPKKPSIKITILDPATPAKKTKKAKGGTQ